MKENLVEEESLILVNKDNKIPDDYKPQLVDFEGYKIDKVCYSCLQEMMKDCRADGGYPCITSIYRSHEEQKEIFYQAVDTFMKELKIERKIAIAVTSWFCAFPGTSEHELGLAADISLSPNYKTDDPLFTSKWLEENSWKYGFILRYPKDKEEITNIRYESWHYRFVGKKHSKQIHESGLSLEEYISNKNNH